MKTNMALLTLLLLMSISLTSCINKTDEALTGPDPTEITKVKASFGDDDNTLFNKITNTYELNETKQYYLVISFDIGYGSVPLQSVPMEDITITSEKNTISYSRTFVDDYIENKKFEKGNLLYSLRDNYFNFKVDGNQSSALTVRYSDTIKSTIFYKIV